MAGEYHWAVDAYTVKVFSKWSGQVVLPTVEEIQQAFDDSDPEAQHVFPGLSGTQRQEVLGKAREMRKTDYRTFQHLINECRPDLDQFYVVMEQIPIWFSATAEKGYNGGTSIANRPRVETTLKSIFDDAGNYAIHLYVLHHYAAMFQKENGDSMCISPDYPDRFEYDVWWDLGYTLLSKWKGPCRWESYLTAIHNYRKGVVVRSTFRKNYLYIEYREQFPFRSPR